MTDMTAPTAARSIIRALRFHARCFCPKCGQEMVTKNGEVTCMSGDMGLSQKMHEGLSAAARYSPGMFHGAR
jgi:hypothetical protein